MDWGSDHTKALIFNDEHCIFKRFSALNDPFGGQNGPFKKNQFGDISAFIPHLPYDVIGNATKRENRRPSAVHY